MTDTVNCPKCGHPNPGGAGDCENCGITFDIYTAEKTRAEAEEQARIEAEEQERKRRESLVPCPKCTHLNDPLSDDCLKCGIVFTKYYDSMRDELADDKEKAGELAELEAAIARHEQMKVKRRNDLEEEARRKEAEEKRRIEELRKERERQEIRRKEKEAQERLARERQEKLRKEKEAQERLERERQEAERRKKEAAERLERERQAAERRKKEEAERLERERQAAARREEEEKARLEQERLEAQEREKQEKEREAALKQELEEKARQAVMAEEAAAKQQEEEERAKEEARRMEIFNQLVKPKGNLKKLLKPYTDQPIGMNYDNPTVVKEVKLASINDDHISVVSEGDGLVYTFPLTVILSIIEGVDGVTAGPAKNQTTFPLIIRVSHRTI